MKLGSLLFTFLAALVGCAPVVERLSPGPAGGGGSSSSSSSSVGTGEPDTTTGDPGGSASSGGAVNAWSHAIDGSLGLSFAFAMAPSGVAVDDQGNVTVVGSFEGTADFGSGPVASNDMADAFVAQYDAYGSLRWARTFGDSDEQFALAVAVDPAGDVFVTGYFDGTIDFGTGALQNPQAAPRGYVVKLDRSGNTQWASTCEGWGMLPLAVAANAQGEVVVASQGMLDKFAADGTHLWAQAIDASGDPGLGVAFDAQGNIALAGVRHVSGYAAFASKLDANGNLIWDKSFANPGYNEEAFGVATDADGDVYVTGELIGSVDFGNGPLSGGSVFLVKFDPSGNALWSRVSKGDAIATARGVAVDAAGNAIITGFSPGPIDFGFGVIQPSGYQTGFVAVYDANGTALTSWGLGTNGDQQCTAVAVDSSGAIALTGVFTGSLGIGTAVAGTYESTFVARVPH